MPKNTRIRMCLLTLWKYLYKYLATTDKTIFLFYKHFNNPIKFDFDTFRSVRLSLNSEQRRGSNNGTDGRKVFIEVVIIPNIFLRVFPFFCFCLKNLLCLLMKTINNTHFMTYSDYYCYYFVFFILKMEETLLLGINL